MIEIKRIQQESCKSNNEVHNQINEDRIPIYKQSKDVLYSKILCFYPFGNNTWSACLRILNHTQKLYHHTSNIMKYRNNVWTFRKLLHDLNLSIRLQSNHNTIYLLIFFFLTGFKYLILTGSPVSISIALNTSLYFPLPTFSII